jgi:hypothetical protein
MQAALLRLRRKRLGAALSVRDAAGATPVHEAVHRGHATLLVPMLASHSIA